jgi:hypothetical protein
LRFGILGKKWDWWIRRENEIKNEKWDWVFIYILNPKTVNSNSPDKWLKIS